MSTDGNDPDTERAEGGTLEDQRRIRSAKVDALRSEGVDPYPDRYERSATSDALREVHGHIEDGGETAQIERVAGRIMLMRSMGKLIFITLRDPGGTIPAIRGEERHRRGTLRRGRGNWTLVTGSAAKVK